jgi:effector-binding domain-containing protein
MGIPVQIHAYRDPQASGKDTGCNFPYGLVYDEGLAKESAMQTLSILILACFAAQPTATSALAEDAGAQTGRTARTGTTPEKQDAGDPVVAIKRSSPMRLVFRDYDGPYWRIGPIIQEVQAYASKSGQSGPLFVRFASSPMRDLPSSLKCQIGFVAIGDHVPAAPFRAENRPTELVACLTMAGRAPSTRGDHQALYDWATRNGHGTGGEIFELYTRDPSREGLAHWRTEVQLVLPTSASTGALHENVVPSEPIGPTPVQRETADKHYDHPSPMAKDVDVPTILPKVDAAVAVPPSPTAAVGGGEQGGTREAEPQFDSQTIAADKPHSEPEKIPVIANETAPAAEIDASPTAARIREPAQSDTPIPMAAQSIQTLIDDGKHDLVALKVVPDAAEISADRQMWLGQFVFRLGAAAKGIRQMSPGLDHPALRAIDEVVSRYRRIMAEAKLEPLAQPVVRLEAGSAGPRNDLRDLMTDLDRLLGRIALKSTDGPAACNEILDLICRAEGVIRNHQNN